ncbi:hypothetical protein BC941DRAFT_421535 [Chlamydoabsidia padenii]|nr:hypothetical protein BC941DRAFT_421535 [Chlamydoabsidia padenii]
MSSENPTLPTLPSIQLMLEGAGIPSLPHKQHRRNASDVVGHFKSLSLTAPTPMEPSASPNPSTAPSSTTWPIPFRPTPLYQHSYQTHPRSARNLHSRSYSDYTHPYATSPPNGLLAPQQQQQQQQQHRRAVSTSTVELMKTAALSPPALYPSHSTSTVPSSPTLSTSVDEEEHDLKQTATTTTNKYQCEYCQKGFSRPSSLRIHTYSHTGEKPFTCPEPNCDRSFSVQSNMRRHIRVHKLNGKHLKMRRSPPPIKPLAAKPSWMQGSQDITTTSLI